MTTAPKITLKNVKYADFASQETSCFEATVYVDGKRFCHVQNDGHGGPDMFSPLSGPQNAFYAEGGPYKALEARIEATVPTVTKWETEMQPDLSWLVSDALTAHLMEKEVKKKMRSKVLVLEDEQIFAYGWKGVRKITDGHLAAFAKQKPGAVMLNVLPLEKAVELYSKHAG